MSAIIGVKEIVALALAVAALVGVGASAYRWGFPRFRDRRERERSTDIVLHGRPAIPANPITGEPEQPPIPSIGQQVADLRRLVEEIHHETHHNNGSSIKDAVARVEKRLAAGDRRFERVEASLGEINGRISGELAVSNGALAHPAEASKTGLRVIEKAIDAEPPVDLD